MATLEQLGQWIVDNQDKQGTEEFNTVAQAYRQQRGGAPEPTQEPGFWDKFAFGFDSTRGLTQAAVEEFAKRVKPDPEGAREFVDEPGFILPGIAGSIQVAAKALKPKTPKEFLETQQRLELEKDLELEAEHPEVFNDPDAQTSGPATVGRIVRQLMDPTTLIGPMAGTGLKGMAAINASIAAADSTAIQMLEQGEVDPRQVLLAASMGAAIAPVAKGVAVTGRAIGKKISQAGREEVTQKTIQKTVVEAGARKQAYQRVGLNEQEATARAVRDVSPRADVVKTVDGETVDLIKTVQRGPQLRDKDFANTTNAITRRFNAVAGSEKKLAKFEKKLQKAVTKERRASGNTFTNIYRSAYDAMSRVSPRLANRLRRYEFELGTAITSRLGSRGLNILDESTGAVAGPTLQAWKKVPAGLKRDTSLAMFNGDTAELAKLQPKLPDQVNQTIDAWRVLREEYRTRIQESGHGELDWVDEYFPREFVDTDHMKAHFLKRGVSGKIVDQTTADLQRLYKGDPDSLTIEKRINALNSHVRAPVRVGAVRTGPTSQMKERQLDVVKTADLPAMRDPFETMAKYVNDVEANLAKRRLFGVDPNDLGASIGARMDELVANGDLTPADAELARRILQARFVSGERSMSKVAQDTRNITNAVLLGNPGSALVQFGDIAVGMAHNGVRNTLRALWDVMGRRNEFRKIDLGITDVAAELNQRSRAGTGEALDALLTWSGFRGVDTFGKQVAIQGGLNKLRRWARKTPRRLEAKYKDALTPNELQALTNALKAKSPKDLTEGQNDLVRYALFNELSDMQPISLSEMPVQYLEFRNGRLAYQLKSFTLKQQELIRREFFNKLKSDPGSAIAFGSRYLLAMGLLSGSIDFARDSLTGKYGTEPGNNVDDIVLQGAENVTLSATGVLNRFTTDKILKGDISGAVADTVLPPAVSVAGRITQGIIQGKPEKVLRYVPGVGIFAPWAGDN